MTKKQLISNIAWALAGDRGDTTLLRDLNRLSMPTLNLLNTNLNTTQSAAEEAAAVQG